MGKTGKIVGAGIGLAALTAAGTYFLYGEKNARNREKVRGWALKMKGEILQKLEDARKIDREAYLRMVDKVADRYAELGTISAAELRALTVDLKNAWVHINKKL